jgi:uncharacterized RDD family membrane protein YckC
VRDDLAVTYNAYGVPRDPTAIVGRRVIAFIIDWIILGVAVFIAASLANPKTVDKQDSFLQGRDICDLLEVDVCFEDDDTAYVFEQTSDLYLVVAIPALTWVSNLVILQGMTGATAGKFALGLRVVNTRGGNAGVGRALVRSLFLLPSAIFFYLPSLIPMLTTRGHRRIGDMVGGTYVISAQDAMNGVVPGEPMPAAAPQAAPAWVPPDAAPSGGWTPPAPPSAPPPADDPPAPSAPW